MKSVSLVLKVFFWHLFSFQISFGNSVTHATVYDIIKVGVVAMT